MLQRIPITVNFHNLLRVNLLQGRSTIFHRSNMSNDAHFCAIMKCLCVKRQSKQICYWTKCNNAILKQDIHIFFRLFCFICCLSVCFMFFIYETHLCHYCITLRHSLYKVINYEHAKREKKNSYMLICELLKKNLKIKRLLLIHNCHLNH